MIYNKVSYLFMVTSLLIDDCVRITSNIYTAESPLIGEGVCVAIYYLLVSVLKYKE